MSDVADLTDGVAQASIADSDAAAAAKKAEANRKKREKAKAKKQVAKAEAEKTLSCSHNDNANDFMLENSSRVDVWFAAYMKAFETEHDWMESRKQTTSRQMLLTAAQMLPLVFHDEQGTGLHRVSYFAHYSNASDAVAYATVDEDPDASKVCHLRMLLVAPEVQRQGVGLSLLKHIVEGARFSKRDIGLKYAKCHDYHKLYAAAGFKRIGDDELYVYMALRRAREGDNRRRIGEL